LGTQGCAHAEIAGEGDAPADIGWDIDVLCDELKHDATEALYFAVTGHSFVCAN
jgi:hypothetical protein